MSTSQRVRGGAPGVGPAVAHGPAAPAARARLQPLQRTPMVNGSNSGAPSPAARGALLVGCGAVTGVGSGGRAGAWQGVQRPGITCEGEWRRRAARERPWPIAPLPHPPPHVGRTIVRLPPDALHPPRPSLLLPPAFDR